MKIRDRIAHFLTSPTVEQAQELQAKQDRLTVELAKHDGFQLRTQQGELLAWWEEGTTFDIPTFMQGQPLTLHSGGQTVAHSPDGITWHEG